MSSTSLAGSTENQDTSLFLSFAKTVRCQVHPLVFFSILDHFIRRNKDQHRVVGTLLGVVQSGGSVIDITNCFAVPHSDTLPNGSFDMEHHRSMVQLHQKANPNEVVVGWYCTGHVIDRQSVNYHNFYWRDMQSSPILLTLDTDLKGKESMDYRAYISHSLTFSDNPETSLGEVFEPLDLSVHGFDSESIGMDLLLKPSFDPKSTSASTERTDLLSDMSSLRDNFQKVLGLLDDVTAYVDKVVGGTVPANPKIGRFLERTVSALPQINPEAFHQMFNNSLQDILMVVYLANLTRIQLAISERLRQSTQSTSSSS